MLQRVHSPIAAGDRVAGLQSHLVAALSADLTLTTLGVRRFGHVEALVVVHTCDGGREAIHAAEARRLAASLRADWAAIDRRMVEWADSLDEAAEAAERQASAILLGQGSDAGVRSDRIFGGR